MLNREIERREQGTGNREQRNRGTEEQGNRGTGGELYSPFFFLLNS